MPDATPTELVFHAGKPEQQPRGWACVFEVRRGDRVTGRVTTAPLWDSETEAVAAQTRAMEHLKQHNQWPNFCEKW